MGVALVVNYFEVLPQTMAQLLVAVVLVDRLAIAYLWVAAVLG
jgi:hypothetical protein